MSARWYKRCGADFIHGTMMLSLEEKGAYSLCLDLIYDRGGPIPDDARWLSGVCGVSIRKWNAIRNHLLELGKLTVEDGLISNARASFEMVSAELSSRKLAEAGAKGGRKRAENQYDYNVFSELAKATLKLYREDKRREEDKEEEEASPPCAQPVAEAVSFWSEAAKTIGWPGITTLSENRRKLLTLRLREHGIEGWKAAIARAGASPYLGRDPPSWFTFDWLVKAGNFLKLIEGNYDRNRSDQKHGPSAWGAARDNVRLFSE